jgi:hypothetical protein
MDEIREITSYGAKWDLDECEGLLWLKDSDGNVYEQVVKKAKELHLLVHLLQTEKPIYYHTTEHYISTSLEHVGEESECERG